MLDYGVLSDDDLSDLFADSGVDGLELLYCFDVVWHGLGLVCLDGDLGNSPRRALRGTKAHKEKLEDEAADAVTEFWDVEVDEES